LGFSIDFAYGALTQCSATALLVIVCVQLLGGFAPQTPWGHDQGLYPWTPLGAQPPDPRHSPPPMLKPNSAYGMGPVEHSTVTAPCSRAQCPERCIRTGHVSLRHFLNLSMLFTTCLCY